MKTAEISFASNEQHMLYGLMAFMYAQGQKLPDKGAAWVIIGRKVRSPAGAQYSEDEVALLNLAVEATLAAGEKALEKLPEEDVAARLKAGLVKNTYLAIKGRIDNVKWNEIEHDQNAQNLRRNDEGREVPQSDDLLGPTGRASPPPGGDGSGQGS